jgi:1-acyl-sn-glycerol-3-phosphate acyltransferase
MISTLSAIFPALMVAKYFNRRGNPLFAGRVMFFFAHHLFGINLKINGRTDLLADDHKPCVFISNHQSFFDAAVVAGMIPTHTVMIAKKSVIYIPLFGIIYWFLGNILIDRGNRNSSLSSMSEAAEQVARKCL